MNIREKIASKLAAKKTETAADDYNQREKKIIAIGQAVARALKSRTTGLAGRASTGYQMQFTSISDNKALKSKFLELCEKNGVKVSAVKVEPGRNGRTRLNFKIGAVKTDKESNTKLRVIKPESKEGKKALSKIDAKKAATSTAKAPKGTGKLKSFMKENGIDLKTLKALVKHITPSK